MASKKIYNWPRIVAAFAGLVFAGFVFYIELDLFLNVRVAAFSDASTDDFFDAGVDSACVGHADADRVRAIYDGGKVGQIRPFGLFSLDGDHAVCGDGDAADRLAALAAASVHALAYNAAHPPDGADADALGRAAAAARCAAAGHTVPLAYNDAVLALGSLAPPPVNCSAIYPGAALSPYVHAPVLAPADSELQLQCGDSLIEPACADAGDGALLTHCVQQFQLGRFAPELDAYSLAWVSGYGGTLRLPVHGKVLHPAILPWRNPPNFTDDQPWDKRTRVLVGLRFGLSVWGAMPVLFLATFLAFDCVMMILAQMTDIQRLRATLRRVGPDSNDQNRYELLILAGMAGALAMRRERGLIFGFGFGAAVLVRTVFVFLPWSAGRLLPRAVCEEGGWRSDEPAFELELLSLVLLLCGTLLQPLVGATGIENAENARETVVQEITVANVTFRSAIAQTRGWTTLILAGALACFGVQAMIATIFGEAWVDRILTPVVDDDWSLSKYADVVFGKSLGALGIALSSGIALAAVLARWKFPGNTTTTLIVLIVWALGSLLALLPLFLIEDFSFDEDKFKEDCDKTVDRGACDLRFYAYWASVGVFLLPVLILLLGCAVEMATVPARDRHFRGVAEVRGARLRELKAARRAHRQTSMPTAAAAAGDEASRPLLIVRGANGWEA